MPETPRRKPASILQLFCSVRLTLLLLGLIAAASVAGTLIPQGQSQGGTLLLRLGLGDVYHAWWFLGLLALLALNLIACSVERFPAILAAYRGQPEPASLETQAFHRAFVLPGGLEEARDRARKALGPGGVEGSCFHLSRGAYARWGVFVVHTSLLLIFLGVMIGSIWGFKGFINIVEGSSTREVVLRGGAEDGQEHRRALPFELQVDSFRVSRYDTGQPSDYVSHVRVLEQGRTVREQDLRVNAPLSHRGLRFYQSSYGSVPEAGFILQNAKTGAQLQATLLLGEARRLEGGIVLAFDGFSEDHHGMGPAFQMWMQPPGQEPQEILLFQRLPDFDRKRGGAWTLRVGDLKLKQYTGLQVARDPGVPWVWAGCTLLFLGMMGAFFCSHRQFWIRLEACEGGVAWSVAGASSRNRLGFEREFRALLERIGAPDPSELSEDKA